MAAWAMKKVQWLGCRGWLSPGALSLGQGPARPATLERLPALILKLEAWPGARWGPPERTEGILQAVWL